MALSIGFAYLNRDWLFIDLYEVGDFAANSLLVQNAKQWNLLTGHYSRLGFNHPGPAILYVLAAGEWLIYDYLGWVKSPLAGQLVAVGVYNAFWIVMVATLLIRICHSIAIATVALLLFLAASAYFDHLLFASLWPPHLFYFPFATFMLATALLVAGRGDSLVLLAISCGFLMHGYVSFWPICGFVLLAALLINKLNVGQSHGVLSREYFNENAKALMLVAILAVLFLVPLILESTFNYPGPLPKYVAYTSDNLHNGFTKSLQFVAGYWNTGTTPVLLAVSALLFIAVNRSAPNSSVPSGHCCAEMAQVLLLTTGAFLLFVIYGVDDIKRNFVGLFYYSVPAFSLALIPASLLVQRSNVFRVLVAMFVAAVALPYTVQEISKPVGYMGKQYHDAAIPGYYKKMQLLSNATLVLDLDTSREGGHSQIWTTLLGIQSYAARHHSEQLFCIDRGWHVSFTPEARCTNQQIARGARYYLTTSQPNELKSLRVAIDLNGIRFYEIERFRMIVGEPLEVVSNNDAFASSVLLDGWSMPEADLVWTDGHRARFSFWVDGKALPSQLALDLMAFLPLPGDHQTVEVRINDVRADTLHFDAQNNRGMRTVLLHPGMITADGTVIVQLDIHNPISPKATMQSPDSRLLGVGLFGMKILK